MLRHVTLVRSIGSISSGRSIPSRRRAVITTASCTCIARGDLNGPFGPVSARRRRYRLFTTSKKDGDKDTTTTAAADADAGADGEAPAAEDSGAPTSGKPQGGISLPPPPAPAPDTGGGCAFRLPSPPPLNIPGIGIGGGIGGGSGSVGSSARTIAPATKNEQAAGSGSRDKAGGGGPKKIVIDDVWLSGSKIGGGVAASSEAAAAAAAAAAAEASERGERMAPPQPLLPEIPTAMRSKLDGEAMSDAISGGAGGAGTARGEGAVPFLSALPSADGNNNCSSDMGVIDDDDEGKQQQQEDEAVGAGTAGDDGGSSDEEVEDEEHIAAKVTFHPITSISPPSRMRQLEDTDTDAVSAQESDHKDGESGDSTIIPRADLTGLLPDKDESVEFKSQSILSFDDTEEGKEQLDELKEKKVFVKGGVPGAYRVHVDKDDDDKTKKSGDAIKGKRKSSYAAAAAPREVVEIRSIQDGPMIRYGTGKIANLAKGSVMAASGSTVVMSTVVHESSTTTSSSLPNDDAAYDTTPEVIKARAIAEAVKSQCRKYTGLLPLTVSYSERHAGVGKIPSNQARRDNMRPSDAETLAARAIDRALRPLLPRECYGSDDAIEISCSVQAFDRSGRDVDESSGGSSGSGSGDPIAVAINAASSALLKSGLPFTEPVGAVRLCLDGEDTVIFDPSPQQMESSQLDLLVAATRDDIVMLEFGGKPPRAYRAAEEEKDNKRRTRDAEIYADRDPGIPEDVVSDLLRIAHASIHTIIDEQLIGMDSVQEAADDAVSDADLMKELGLQKMPSEVAAFSDQTTDDEIQTAAEDIIEEAFQFVSRRLEGAALRLFGLELYSDDQTISYPNCGAFIHGGPPLLPKSIRGRREHLVRQEILRLLKEDALLSYGLSAAYDTAIRSDSGALDVLTSAIHERLLKKAMYTAAVNRESRGDGRTSSNHRGLITIRPIEATVPLLPDTVHGSSLFSRGETQVMCTTTLGAPREGQPMTNPYVATSTFEVSKEGEKGPYDDLPVGSLRFLKNQQALESDLNSKRVRADREMTGDSGILKEVRRAFLHYDFPSYSTGEVRKGGPAVNRRAVGHGALAERGILPILPPPAAFPYAIRLTSEVTSSNGSSSMASVCGATLALLDAGVPILAPVAGVSVGLVRGETNDEESYGLLLDITGTEDHYGLMDFKVAGTDTGLTAMQLDVKRPLPLDIIIQAMQVAKEGRSAILSSMSNGAQESSSGVISGLKPRRRPKHTAPRVEVVRFDPVRKRDLIGPGGAVLKQLEDRYGVSLDLSQEGQCLLYGAEASAVAKAKTAIMDLVADVEEGEVYDGTVIDIKDFGAVIELLRNKEALLHVSELGDREKHPDGNFGLVKKELEIGQKIKVVCIGVDPVQGDIKVSRKRLLRKELAA